MAAQEAADQKITVFHEFDGSLYRLTFGDPETGATIVAMALPPDQMVEFVSTIVGTLLEHGDD